MCDTRTFSTYGASPCNVRYKDFLYLWCVPLRYYTYGASPCDTSPCDNCAIQGLSLLMVRPFAMKARRKASLLRTNHYYEQASYKLSFKSPRLSPFHRLSNQAKSLQMYPKTPSPQTLSRSIAAVSLRNNGDLQSSETTTLARKKRRSPDGTEIRLDSISFVRGWEVIWASSTLDHEIRFVLNS